MQQHASVLLFGQDARLVETRGWVLRKTGFQIHTALTLSDLDLIATQVTIDLFVLCDSLSSATRTQTVAFIRSRWPLAKRLIFEPSISTEMLDSRESIFCAFDGPRELITAINKMLANDPSTIA
jgi:hypothetical protein